MIYLAKKSHDVTLGINCPPKSRTGVDQKSEALKKVKDTDDIAASNPRPQRFRRDTKNRTRRRTIKIMVDLKQVMARQAGAAERKT